MFPRKISVPVVQPVAMSQIPNPRGTSQPAWRTAPFKGIARTFAQMHKGLHMRQGWLQSAELFQRGREAEDAIDLALLAFSGRIVPSRHQEIGKNWYSFVLSKSDLEDLADYTENEALERAHSVEYEISERQAIIQIHVKDRDGKVMASLKERSGAMAAPAWRTKPFDGVGIELGSAHIGLSIRNDWLGSAKLSPAGVLAEDAIALALLAFEGDIDPERYTRGAKSSSFSLSRRDLDGLKGKIHNTALDHAHKVEYTVDNNDQVTGIQVSDKNGKRIASLGNEILPSALAQGGRHTLFHRGGVAPTRGASNFCRPDPAAFQNPALAWLTKDATHANVVLPSDHLTNARRFFQQMLEQTGKRVVYAPDAQTLEELQSELSIDKEGKLALADGPLNKLMEHGGVLMLDVSGFTPQQMEALNSLMEEQQWEGEKLANPVRVICLCNEDTMKENRLSGAQISRTAFYDMSAAGFPSIPDLPVSPAVEYGEPRPCIIDLQHDSQWAKILHGGPSLDERQQWKPVPGKLPPPGYGGPVVIRNAPADPLLMDQLLTLKNNGMQIKLEQGLPPSEVQALLGQKFPATDMEDRLRAISPAVCVVNTSTMDEVLNEHFGVRDGKPVRLPPVMEQIERSLPSGELPQVYVTESLSLPQWERLMLHPARFGVAVAPGVEVPDQYRDHVAEVKPTTPMDIDSGMVATPDTGSGVVFKYSLDPTLAERELAGKEATRLFVTPGMRGDAVLYSLRRESRNGAAEEAGSRNVSDFSFKVEVHQLVRDLQAGKHVILRDLETNEALARDLGPLLQGQYLHINGQRLHFGPGGGLTGKLTIITDSQDLIQQHPLARQEHADTTEAQWKSQVVQKLQQRFGAMQDVEERLEALLKTFRILAQQGVVREQEPPVNFATLETLFHHLFAGRTGDVHMEDGDRKEARLVRSLFKDLLIGDSRDTGSANDPQYAYLKICLRMQFPQEMEMMPPKSVDITRLQELLARANHVEDIRNNAWMFLNAFGHDVIKAVVGEELDGSMSQRNSKSIANKVVALVRDQAQRHGLAFDLAGARQLNAGSRSAVRETLQAYQRPPRMAREERTEMKTRRLLGQGNAAFFQGPPGAGKTHAALRMAENTMVIQANIGDEGTPAFENALEAWARHPGPVTLLIDEANLAGKDKLGMLKSVFADNTLYVKGTAYPLSQEHRVLFTGNSDSLAGRRAQQVTRESIPRQQHKAILKDVMGKIFIDPLIARTSEELARPQAQALQYIRQQVLDIHDHMQQAFPELSLSPRNLEEFAAQMLSVLMMSEETHAPEDLAPYMARIALNLYGSGASETDRTVMLLWLMKQLGEEAFKGIDPAKPDWYAIPSMPAVKLDSSIAKTPSTQALANDISWWLNTQRIRSVFNHKEKVLGQRALLIEGPASRGKDTVVEAVLRQHGREFAHINANPNNLDELRAQLDAAQKSGKILVISEINLLPSNVLESILNARLTGDAGPDQHPDFGLILTSNPIDYAGRQPMSEALKNRMQTLSLQPYSPPEIAAIADAIADDLARPTGNIASRMPRIAKERVVELVNNHVRLLNWMQGVSSEFQPGVRQLRNALKRMHHYPNESVGAIFNRMYGFYIAKANTLGNPASRATQPTGKKRETEMAYALRRTLKLAHPEWLDQPRVVPGTPANLHGSHLFFDTDRHEIRFDPAQPLPHHVRNVLRVTEHKLYDSTRLAGVPTVQASATSAAQGGGNSGKVITSRAPQVGQSAVGEGPVSGTIGSFTGSSDLHLATSRTTVGGRLLGSNPAPASNGVPADSSLATIVLQDSPVEVMEDGERRVYLPVPLDTRPTEVTLDGHREQDVFVDKNGGWYVLDNRNKNEIGQVRYGLTACADICEPDSESFRGKVDWSSLPDLAQEIAAIRRERPAPEIAARRLADIFKAAGFEYSHADARALKRTRSAEERIQRFLEHKQGVCHEFSHAFAALLEECGLRTRIVGGYLGEVAENNSISAEGHAWVEYQGGDGKWHSIDPTTFAANGNGQPILNSAAARETRARTPEMESEAEEAVSRATSPSIKTAEEIKVALAKGLQNTPIYAEAAGGLSLGSLGLTNWSMRNDGDLYSTYGGIPDMKRMLEGNPKCFRTSSLNVTEQPMPLYISGLPVAGNSEVEWKRFLLRTLSPLQALLERAVPIYIRKEGGGFERITESWQILQIQPETDGDSVTKPVQEGKLVNAHSGFLDKLASEYYEQLLARKEWTPGNSRADLVFHLLEDWLQYGEIFDSIRELTPLTVDVKGARFDIEAGEIFNAMGVHVENGLISLEGEFEVSPEEEAADSRDARKILTVVRNGLQDENDILLGDVVDQMVSSAKYSSTDEFRLWALNEVYDVMREMAPTILIPMPEEKIHGIMDSLQQQKNEARHQEVAVMCHAILSLFDGRGEHGDEMEIDD